MFLLLLMRQLSVNSKPCEQKLCTGEWAGEGFAFIKTCLGFLVFLMHSLGIIWASWERCRSSSVWSYSEGTNGDSPASSPDSVAVSQPQIPTVSICDETTTVLIPPYWTVTVVYANVSLVALPRGPYWCLPRLPFLCCNCFQGRDGIPKCNHLISFKPQIYGRHSWRTLKTTAFQLPDGLIKDGRGTTLISVCQPWMNPKVAEGLVPDSL